MKTYYRCGHCDFDGVDDGVIKYDNNRVCLDCVENYNYPMEEYEEDY